MSIQSLILFTRRLEKYKIQISSRAEQDIYEIYLFKVTPWENRVIHTWMNQVLGRPSLYSVNWFSTYFLTVSLDILPTVDMK